MSRLKLTCSISRPPSSFQRRSTRHAARDICDSSNPALRAAACRCSCFLQQARRGMGSEMRVCSAADPPLVCSPSRTSSTSQQLTSTPPPLPFFLVPSVHLPPLRLSHSSPPHSLTPRPHHSLEHYRSYITLPYLPLISPTPLLLVVPSKDHVCASDLQLSAYEAAREPKQLELVQGAGHFDIYEGEIWERIVSVQEEFLRRWLC